MNETKTIIINPTFKLKKLLREIVGDKPGFNLVWQMALDFMVKSLMKGMTVDTAPEYLKEAFAELQSSCHDHFDRAFGFELTESRYQSATFTFKFEKGAVAKATPNLNEVVYIHTTPFNNGWTPGVIWLRPIHCPFYFVKETRNPLADFVQETQFLIGKHHRLNLFQRIFDGGDDRKLVGVYFETESLERSVKLNHEMSDYVRCNKGILEEGERKIHEFLAPGTKEDSVHQGKSTSDYSGINGVGRNQVCVRGKEYRNVMSFFKESRIPLPQIYRRLNSHHKEWVDWFFIGSIKDNRRKAV